MGLITQYEQSLTFLPECRLRIDLTSGNCCSLPQQSAILFPENGGTIKFSPQGELLAAVNSLDGTLKVLHTTTQNLKLNVSLTLPTNVQWHFHYPLVCVGDDSKLCFWKVSAF